MTPAPPPPPPLSRVFLYHPGYSCGCFCGFSPIMALGVYCFRRLHPAFCTYLATLTRPVSEVSMKPVHGRQHDHRQYLAYPAVPVRQFATKKAKAKGKGQPQARVNINTALVEDIINLEEVDEEMKSVMEALKDNFNKTLNIRTAPGSLDHITVVTADGKLALNHIGQISMKSPQLILVNMASFPECTAAAIKAIRESGMNLNPEVEGTLIWVPIPKVTREHREMLVKLAKQNTNKAKENLRKVRTNAMNKLKKSKDKASEDTIRLIEKQAPSLNSKHHFYLTLLPTKNSDLISRFSSHSESWIEHIRILKIITDKFLPHVNHLTLEQSVFSQILPKTIKLFDGMIYELTTQATELSSQNLEIQITLRNILQTMAQILGGLTGFVHHVCTTQESVILEYIHSLPSSILHIIKKTFVHCKNSESLYSGRLHLLSDLLQGLFREAYSLQKKLMELLDMVCMGPSVDENNILLMVEVIHSLLDVCSVISGMDQAFHANTWKFIIKQSLKHQSVIKSQLKHKEIISSLCEDIVFSFHSCLQLAEQMVQPAAQDNADYRIFQKTLKLCRFFANSLLHYTKEFLPLLSDSCCILHQLYLQIYSKFPPNLCAARISKAQQEEIAGTFLVVLDPLISQLLTFQPFVQTVLDSKLDLPCELQLPQVLLLIVVADKLPSRPKDVQTLWCTEATARVSLIKAIFYSFERCSGELSLTAPLQGVKDNRQAEVSVTLYQHACVHLCAFVASFHPSLFPELDAALLNAVLSTNMTTSLLAMDVWCFLARYGTAELCMHHVTLMAHLIKSCPGECIQLTNLTLLLRRLFFFMTPPHQVEFIQRFSPKEADNLPLWQCISFQSLSADLRKEAACEVIKGCTAQCIKWLSSSHTLAELDYLNTALSALLTVCNSAGDALDIRQQTTVTEVVSQLWAFINIQQVISQPYVQQAFSLLLQLLAFFIQTVDPQLISQVVTLLTSLLKLEPPDHVSLAALDFISSLGRFFIPQAIQDKVLPNLSCIFALLLANKNWLLEQHTLEAFTQFAEGTNHEEIVPQCLNSEEIKNKVVAFLEKTGLVDETEAAIVDRVKQEKGTFWEPAAKVTVGEANGLALQPCTKRARQELPFEEEYRLAFQAAAGALETTEMLLQQAPAPDWLVVELEALQEKIEKLKCCVPEGI